MRALRTCLFWLVAYAAVAWGLSRVFERRLLPREPALAAGAFAGFVAILGILWLLEIVTKLRSIAAVRRGLQGEEPVDGERYAACGPIEPAGIEPLVTPFTHTPAVAYTCRLVTLGDRRAWEGIALAPARIQCGAYPIRILALPEIAVDEELCTGEEASKNAQAWAEETVFSGERSTLFRRAKLPESVLRNENGAVEWNSGEGKPASFRGAMLHERVIKPGDEVCAIGVYSSARGGLVVDPTARGYSITLRKGKPASAGTALFGSIGNVVKAAIAFGLVAVAIAGLQTFVPLGAVEIERPDLRPSWLEVGIDDFLEASVRTELNRAGLTPAISSDPGQGLPLGAARGRVRRGETEVDVVTASVSAAGDSVDVLLFDVRGRTAAAVKISPRGGLLRARILGEEIDFRRVPLATYDFRPGGEGAIAGRLSWYAKDAPSARVRFRAAVVDR
ncbi:MAG TPA: hypothetical protein VLV48_10085 [Thermoanaerobaculia bacterium]|nr:hypothetical protein [Thermoanaerobaculia bacterium]